MSRGRPSTFTPEMADKICELLATGRSLREVGRMEGFPPATTIREWISDNVTFAVQYARARERGYQEMADEILEIADDGRNDWTLRQNDDGESVKVLDHEHIQRSKLRYDARRWLLSKCLPKIYGDKLELGGPDGGPLQVAVVRFTETGGGDGSDAK